LLAFPVGEETVEYLKVNLYLIIGYDLGRKKLVIKAFELKENI
jgi:hypothetical protein